jgi:hypothetical protein
MRRTLREWEQLWRERWDINDYADLDQVFAGTEDLTVLAHHRYTILELGRVELEVEVIASLNTDPEDEEGGEAEPLPASDS